VTAVALASPNAFLLLLLRAGLAGYSALRGNHKSSDIDAEKHGGNESGKEFHNWSFF